MFDPAPQDSVAPDAASDPSVARAERRLRLLEELAEIGMELARALKLGALAAAESPSDARPLGEVRDPADAFRTLSRAVRLTLALEARTDRELRDLRAGVAEKQAAWDAEAGERRLKTVHAYDTKVIESVVTVAWDQCETLTEFENLRDALEERLAQDLAYFDNTRRPLRETVERLCKDLTLEPDWSRWDGEGWIDADKPSRPRFSAFNTPSARPRLHKGDEDGETPATPWRLRPARPPTANNPAAHDLALHDLE